MTDAGPDLDSLLAEVLLMAEGRADPYPRYATIREHSPAYVSGLGPVVVGRYETCHAVLRDNRFGQPESLGDVWSGYGLTEDEWRARFPAYGVLPSALLGLNPPDHTRIRSLVAKAFTPTTVEALRPGIAALTDDLLDRFDGTADVIAELALQLPITVIGEMLGVPAAERAAMQPLVRDAVATLEVNPTLEQLDAADAAERGISALFEGLMADRRANPTDDLLTHLLQVEEEGDRLTHGELLSTVLLLFGAGFETTTNLIGNGLLALLDHPAQLQRLRAEPGMVRTAIDELLRFDSPVQLTSRTALEPVVVEGIEVSVGQPVLTMLGSGNRDPRRFEDPDALDIGRTGAPPLSFGSGIHHCIGSALARAEGQIVFTRLLERFATIEPAWDQRPVYRDSIVLRGLESLPVGFS